ncbi:5-hydroxytryptamine receptor 3A-like [Clupea harengus]|uniref:5-hydroxytryptamine receptor 3A-like n=1 Tax=Clupea harengus TaxID=7950 RepID=A0A8M1KHI7_CLUHA|nr:5-hydroxytryptamine receptor 3A-like [Clupea harengus]
MAAVRPVNNLNTPTNVSISFTLYGILGVTWEIEFLSWDPVECGTASITLPRKKFWVPDIVIDEFVDENNAPETFYVSVSHTGVVQDSLPVEVISSCNLDIYNFPFDIQNCSYTFNSWIHHADEIQLSFGKQVEEMFNRSKKVIATMGEWELIDMKAYKHDLVNFDESKREQLTYFIALRRQPTMYVVNLLIPSFFLITVDLFSFLLPPQNVDRSAFKMTLILGYTVFLLLMNDLLPVTGNTIPLISKLNSTILITNIYCLSRCVFLPVPDSRPFSSLTSTVSLDVFFSLCLALMVGSLLETILITNMLSGSIRDLPLPTWIRVIFLNFLAPLVCMGKKGSEGTPSQKQESYGENPADPSKGESRHGTRDAKESQTADPSLLEVKHLREELRDVQRQLEKPDTTDHTAEDWMCIALVIDRFLFCSYVIFLLFSSIAILVIWISMYGDSQDH